MPIRHMPHDFDTLENVILRVSETAIKRMDPAPFGNPQMGAINSLEADAEVLSSLEHLRLNFRNHSLDSGRV